EADPGGAAIGRENGGVDADDFALDVYERSARVSAVDGGVRLDHMGIKPALDLQRLALGRNYSQGDGLLQGKRRSDCDRPVSNPRARFREPEIRKGFLGVDPDQ